MDTRLKEYLDFVFEPGTALYRIAQQEGPVKSLERLARVTRNTFPDGYIHLQSLLENPSDETIRYVAARLGCM